MGVLDFSALKIPGAYDPNAWAVNEAPQQTAQAPQQAPGVLDALFAPKAPYQPTAADRWNIIGATLRDAGAGLRGENGDALAKAQQSMAAEAGQGGMPGSPAKAKGGSPAYSTADLYKVAQSLFPGDPKAQFLWTSQNQDFLKEQASQYGFHDVAGGNSYGTLTGGMQVAPKLTDHEGQYGTQTAGGYQGTGTAAPSYADATGAANAATEAARAAETARNNHVMEGQGAQRIGLEGGQLGVARQNAGTSAGHLDFERLNAARKENPNAVVVTGPDDIARLPPGTAFIAAHDPYAVVRHK